MTAGPDQGVFCEQDEELDEHKVQVTPPGFHVICLPFADDFRKLKYEETPRGMNKPIEYCVLG